MITSNCVILHVTHCILLFNYSPKYSITVTSKKFYFIIYEVYYIRK